MYNLEEILQVISSPTVLLPPLKGVSKMNVHSSSAGGDPNHPYDPRIAAKEVARAMALLFTVQGQGQGKPKAVIVKMERITAVTGRGCSSAVATGVDNPQHLSTRNSR